MVLSHASNRCPSQTTGRKASRCISCLSKRMQHDACTYYWVARRPGHAQHWLLERALLLCRKTHEQHQHTIRWQSKRKRTASVNQWKEFRPEAGWHHTSNGKANTNQQGNNRNQCANQRLLESNRNTCARKLESEQVAIRGQTKSNKEAARRQAESKLTTDKKQPAEHAINNHSAAANIRKTTAV